jgi:hypothetical protein
LGRRELPVVDPEVGLGGRALLVRDDEPGEQWRLPGHLGLQAVRTVGADQALDRTGEALGIQQVGEQVDVVGVAAAETMRPERVTAGEDEPVVGESAQPDGRHPGLELIHADSLPNAEAPPVAR